MRKGSWAVAALTLVLPTAAVAQPADPWLGRDKMLHFGASSILAVAGYGAGSLLWEERSARLAAGASVALGAGIAKELYDLAGYGHPSWRDMAWNAIGTGAGLALAWGTDELFFRASPGAKREPVVLGLSGSV
jgi:putative lipoprotein